MTGIIPSLAIILLLNAHCEALNVFMVPALGRFARLGDIYDDAKEIVSNQSVFNRPLPRNLTENWTLQDVPKVKWDVIRTLEDKTRLLSVDPTFVTRLKTEFLSINRTYRGQLMGFEYFLDERKQRNHAEGAIYMTIRLFERRILRNGKTDLRRYLGKQETDISRLNINIPEARPNPDYYEVAPSSSNTNREVIRTKRNDVADSSTSNYERQSGRNYFEIVPTNRNQELGSALRHNEISSLNQNQEFGSPNRNQEIGSSNRNQEIGSLNRNQEIGSSNRNQEIQSSDRNKELRSSSDQNQETDQSIRNPVDRSIRNQEISSSHRNSEISQTNRNSEMSELNRNKETAPQNRNNDFTSSNRNEFNQSANQRSSKVLTSDPLVVARIVYGTNLVIKVINDNSNPGDDLESLMTKLRNEINSTIANRNTNTGSDYKFEIFSDTPISENITHFSQISDLLRKLPKTLTRAGAIPIEYYLIRSSELLNLTSNIDFDKQKLKSLYDRKTDEILGSNGMFKHLSDISVSSQMLNEFQSEFNRFNQCVPHGERLRLNGSISRFKIQCVNFRRLVRSFGAQTDKFKFIEEVRGSDFKYLTPGYIQKLLDTQYRISKKRILNCKLFESIEIQYVGEEKFITAVYDFRNKFLDSMKPIILFYFSVELQQANEIKFESNLKTLTALKENVPVHQMLVLDCEFGGKCESFSGNETVISMYVGNDMIFQDVDADYLKVLDYLQKSAKRASSTTEESMITVQMDEDEFDKNSTAHSNSTENEQTSTVVVIGSVLAALAVILVILVIIVFTARKKINSLQSEIRKLSDAEVQQFFEGDPNFDASVPNAPIEALPFDRKYEIAEDHLTIHNGKVIGSGHAGVVMRGSLQDDIGKMLEVAVKTTRVGSDVCYFKSLLGELKILSYVGQSDYIVSLIGVVTTNIQDQRILIATEWCQNGDLHRFLVKNRKAFSPKFRPQPLEGVRVSEVVQKNFSTLDLLRWSLQIAKGMKYLEEKKVIHGDVATRNILLTLANNAKISDFGLSRQLIKYSQYKKKSMDPLPWKWMAIESLRDLNFSLQSDVWSYGVTLWEIFSLGEVPYPGQNWDSSFTAKLLAGERLNRPRFANAHIYNIMLDCWLLDPLERTCCSTIIDQLQRLLVDMGSCETMV